MRLWSLHPKHLDARGLVALWREALLAQAVLRGKTVGYRNHPQLIRFRETKNPVGVIAEYLRTVQNEATRRGYTFDAKKIGRSRSSEKLKVSRAQLDYEWSHLMRKVKLRDPKWHAVLRGVVALSAHPMFKVVRGEVASWERAG